MLLPFSQTMSIAIRTLRRIHGAKACITTLVGSIAPMLVVMPCLNTYGGMRMLLVIFATLPSWHQIRMHAVNPDACLVGLASSSFMHGMIAVVVKEKDLAQQQHQQMEL
jgi:hypothetical protein